MRVSVCGQVRAGERVWASACRRACVGKCVQASVCGQVRAGERVWTSACRRACVGKCVQASVQVGKCVQASVCGQVRAGERVWASACRRACVGKCVQASMCGQVRAGERVWANACRRACVGKCVQASVQVGTTLSAHLFHSPTHTVIIMYGVNELCTHEGYNLTTKRTHGFHSRTSEAHYTYYTSKHVKLVCTCTIQLSRLTYIASTCTLLTKQSRSTQWHPIAAS